MANQKGLLRVQKLLGLVVLLLLTHISTAFAQGSIFGTVQNSNLTTPANGEISFYGFTDNTDDEIRLESSVGAGYDAGNWFDDFQNYLSKTPGNPYQYRFFNTTNGQGAVLAKTIPNNSFQQEDISLATVSWPAAPSGMAARIVSSTSLVLTWTRVAGMTYHVYRRLSTSDGSFFRLDNTAGSLAAPGVADSFFVDNTVSGGGSYSYLLIAQDGSGTLSPHSAIFTVSTAAAEAPIATAINPTSGSGLGGTVVTISGTGFDMAGTTVTVGGAPMTSVTVVSPYQITGTTPAGAAGAVNVIVRNTASALADTLLGGYTYLGNQAPVLAAIGAKSVAEGATLSFGVTATDPDGTTPVLTTSALPTNATFADNGNGTGTFTFNPTITQSGTYNVTFRASDGTAIDSEVVVITVSNTNQAPVLAAIGAKSTNEGQLLTFGVSATDADGTTPSFTTSTLPTNATFTDNGNGTGTFNFTPSFTQAGTYNITFRASDGTATDSEIVVVTVTNVNQAPILAAIGAKSTNEGQLLTFGVSATDADGTTLTLTTSTLPTGAVFTDNGNNTGTFNFTPTFTQAGSYNVTFRASDGTAIDSETIAITVNNVNQAPVLAAIGPKSVVEGGTLSFGVSASDADGTTPTLTTSALPTNANFVDNGNGTGSFTFNPDFTQGGTYNITFRASDGTAIDSEVVVVTVGNQNLPPVLAAIGNKGANEGQLLTFSVTASDPDGTTPSLTTSTLPTNATFTDNGNGTGTFNFTPSFSQAGSYNVTFRASDGALVDSETITINVNNINQAPVLAAIGPQAVTEGQTLNVSVSATDADGTTPTLTTSALPTNATFTDHGNGTASFAFNPSFTQAGSYNVTFYASDGAAIDSERVTITVGDAGNQAPVLAFIGAKSVTEGQLLNFGVSATDIDATTPTLTTSALPPNATFVDNGNGTGTFNFAPSFTQAGSITVTFRASDGVAVDSEQVTITVIEAGNQAPVLAAIGPKSVTESQTLAFTVSASDADGTTPSFTTSALPANATFTDNGNGTGSFSFTPSFVQAGSYTVTFRAGDGTAVDSEAVVITVIDAGNQAPVLAAIGPKFIAEGASLSFGLSATDADGTIPAFTSSALPAHASLVDNNNGTASFTFDPDFTQSGTYNITFRASDGTATDSETVVVTVTDAGNQPPVLGTIGGKVTTEGQTLSFNVTAIDPDGVVPSLLTSSLPLNASFVDHNNGTGTFTFSPSFVQAGSFNITFYASDGSAIDSEQVAIIVNEAGNQPPTLLAIGNQTVTEGQSINLAIAATDPDNTTLTLSTSALPTNATFIDNGGGNGMFSFTPSFTQSGSYSVTFRVSDGQAIDSEIVQITVVESGNQAPVLAAIGAQSVTETQTLSFTVSATDADGTTPTFTTSTLPANASFVDHGNGTGTFTFTPSFAQAGTFDVTFRATDGSAVDTELVTITVIDAGNQAPVLAAIGPKNVTEGQTLAFIVSGADPDATPLTLTASPLPPNATFTDHGDGTASFSFTPNYTQAGTYDIAFAVSDGTVSDSEVVTITVTESGNVSPIFAPVNDTTVSEGGSLAIEVSATDPDGTGFPALSVSTSLLHYSFVDHGNGTGTLTYNPDYLDAGLDTVRFFATDFSSAPASEIAVVTTSDVNRPPTFLAINAKQVGVGDSIVFVVTAKDTTDPLWPRRLYLSAVQMPAGAQFTDNGNSTGTFRWSPTSAQIQSWQPIFLAADQGNPQLSSSLPVAIKVVAVNNPPTLNLAAAEARTVTEGQTLAIDVVGSDPDGVPPTITADNLPANATLTQTGAGSAQFVFRPDYTQGGSLGKSKLYTVTIKASDGYLTAKSNVTIQVYDAGNQAPVFDTLPVAQVTEGQDVVLRIRASDPDGGSVTLTAVNSTMPSNATFADSGNGLATISFNPSYTQAGTYNVQVTANDGTKQTTATITITVLEAGNQPPVIATIGDKTVTETQALIINVTASDPDGDLPKLTTATLPTGATFQDYNNGTGRLTWVPTSFQAGVYPVKFYAEDRAVAGVFDSQLVTITVLDSNQVPIIYSSPINPSTTIYEGDTLYWRVEAADDDSTIPHIVAALDGQDTTVIDSHDTLATNMIMTDSGNGVGILRFTPDWSQGGAQQILYTVRFFALDAANPAIWSSTNQGFTVKNRNAPPQLAFTAGEGPFTLKEGDSLKFLVSATDPDGGNTVPTITATNLPANATLTSTVIYKTFKFLPDFTQAGTYVVHFYATDASVPTSKDSVYITITVTDAPNQPTTFTTALPDTMNIATNVLTQIVIRAADPERGKVTLTADPVLPGAAFVDSGNGVGVYSMTPDSASTGSLWDVTFTAKDPLGASSTSQIHLRVVTFLRGDLDQNGKYTMIDLAQLINYLLRQGPTPVGIQSADVNGDKIINLADLAYLIGFMYGDGPRPPQ